jgi:hypothetical protein
MGKETGGTIHQDLRATRSIFVLPVLCLTGMLSKERVSEWTRVHL